MLAQATDENPCAPIMSDDAIPATLVQRRMSWDTSHLGHAVPGGDKRRSHHMSVDQPTLEALGDHDYLVRIQQGEDTVVLRVHADPAVVERIADEEQRVVEATAVYLIARQSADELPEQVDLDDVAAAYDGYVEDLQRQLTPPSSN
jgi:hypothetical protein